MDPDVRRDDDKILNPHGGRAVFRSWSEDASKPYDCSAERDDSKFPAIEEICGRKIALPPRGFISLESGKIKHSILAEDFLFRHNGAQQRGRI